MKIILLAVAFVSIALLHVLLDSLAQLSHPLQNLCTQMFPFPTLGSQISSSFVCGVSLRDPFASSVFVGSGLIHLIVVSGGHLQLISSIMTMGLSESVMKHPRTRWLLGSLLLIYTLISGFQAPVVRAFVTWGLRELNVFFRWGWDSNRVYFWGGGLLLILRPSWIFSISFYLSWLTCLGFLAPPLCLSALRHRPTWRERKIQQINNWWLSTFLIQVLIGVFFWSFSITSFIVNALLTPPLSLLLAPLSLLQIFFPGFCDSLWSALVLILKIMSSNLNAFFRYSPPVFPRDLSQVQWPCLWLFILLVHGGFYALKIQRFKTSKT